MSRYRLTERAADELLGIYLFGIEQFGPIQAATYLDELEHCFVLLAANPRMGRPAPRIGESVRRHEHASHVILYELDIEDVVVLAVVHGSSVHGLEL